MKEYTATLHGYEVVTPPRCKLERLEPTTCEIVLPLHYAESAPVAMRVAGPLEYTGKDGNKYTWRADDIELLALDGKLWKRYGDTSRWHEGAWTLDQLADQCAGGTRYQNYLHYWPWQYSDKEPPRGLLVRDCGTWATVENLRAQVLEGCDRYAVIAGELYEPARELVYTYDRFTPWGWGRKDQDGRRGSVIVAREYDPINSTRNYLCNALQNWRVVNIYDEYADRLQDKMFNEVTGADVIEVLMPECVKADPYADFWREEIKRLEDAAAKCIESAKDSEERARTLRENAKKERAEAKSKRDAARKTAEKLEAYLNAKEA